VEIGRFVVDIRLSRGRIPPLRLGAMSEELEAAADWVRAEDTSPDFARILYQVVSHVREDLR
jgi:hypothetical protein